MLKESGKSKAEESFSPWLVGALESITVVSHFPVTLIHPFLPQYSLPGSKTIGHPSRETVLWKEKEDCFSFRS